jgi:ketol-acid reductoisomerase
MEIYQTLEEENIRHHMSDVASRAEAFLLFDKKQRTIQRIVSHLSCLTNEEVEKVGQALEALLSHYSKNSSNPQEKNKDPIRSSSHTLLAPELTSKKVIRNLGT